MVHSASDHPRTRELPPGRRGVAGPPAPARLATAGLGIALHAALTTLGAGPLGIDPPLAYLVPLALAVLAPRTLGRAGPRTATDRRDHRGSRLPRAVQLGCETAGWYLFVLADAGRGLPIWLAAALAATAATAATAVLLCWTPGAGAAPRWWRGLSVAVTVPLGVLLAVRAAQHHHAVLLAAWTAVSLLMLLVAVLTLVRGQYSWQLPERVHHVDLADSAPPRHRFSLIVPARDEPVLGRTLAQILAGDYPQELVDVVVMVSHDEVDELTRRIAEQVAARHPNVRVLAPEGSLRSKPLSLEDARRHCTGDLIGVVDAESLIATGLLSYVNTLALRQADVGIFQGGVQLMNVRAPARRPGDTAGAGPRAILRRLGTETSWWRARNCLEYYIWFMSRLRFQARARFIPLGGNTVFIRREVLDQLDGWDVSCLTEDCDLGVRASVAGVRTTVFYHPDLTTQEETPESLTKLVVQRTRWMMGFMQVLFKGDWRLLPGARQRLMAAEMLTMPFFQAMAGVLLPVSLLLTWFLAAPTGLVIVFCLPMAATVMSVWSEQAAFREFADAYDLNVGRWDSVRLVLSAPFYQLMLSIAAVRATARLLRGRLEWEKTSHSGTHHGTTTGSGRFGLEAAS
ncbi:Glycosyl transferase [Frankia canadensis]|uniref:Glycosyl transferase n=1 Tax=Frankia canadensis TaxID=1836972 RepID=A0A2I2KRT3_9ACTN|nr:glycosyltransferase family 2 protein [Frankia canadensis]SNQ48381.1 Glycosyl transferase [Frankia canadensis]SOU55671.1 Glycosyl transferase [Frankia canadensis]